MGIKKYKNLFQTSNGKKKARLSVASNNSKKSEELMEQELRKEKNIKEKAEVEQLQKAISQKLKDPAMAKKAAQILEELLKGIK